MHAELTRNKAESPGGISVKEVLQVVIQSVKIVTSSYPKAHAV